MKLWVILLIFFSLSGCSSYPSKFKCPDAKGLGCTMLSSVDKQINSGEIKGVYRAKIACGGKHCPISKYSELEDKPKFKRKQKQKVKLIEPNTSQQDYVSDGEWNF